MFITTKDSEEQNTHYFGGYGDQNDLLKASHSSVYDKSIGDDYGNFRKLPFKLNGSCAIFNDIFLGVVNALNRANIKYDPSGPNSNSFAYTAIVVARLTSEFSDFNIIRLLGPSVLVPKIGAIPGWGQFLNIPINI